MDFEFMKEWCAFILKSINERYSTFLLQEHQINELNNVIESKSEKKLNLLYGRIYSSAIADLTIDNLLNEKLRKQFGKVLSDVKPAEYKTKEVSGTETKELKNKRDWSMLIIDFIFSKNKSDMGELVFRSMKDTILDSFRTKDIKGIRMIYNDINEWANEWASGAAKDLRKTELSELNKILLEKFGRTLTDDNKEIESRIEKIIKRGKINNEDECRLILTKVDEIYEDESKADMVQVLNNLLLKYDKAAR